MDFYSKSVLPYMGDTAHCIILIDPILLFFCSNVIMIIPPLIFAYQAKKEGLERRYFWLQLTVLLVGIGSWLFHMTLRYGMQITGQGRIWFDT